MSKLVALQTERSRPAPGQSQGQGEKEIQAGLQGMRQGR